MKSMVNLALFDFCETLVDFQTADAFVDFVRKREQKRRMKLLNQLFILMEKLKFFRIIQILKIDTSLSKRTKLWQLKSLEDGTLIDHAEQFYRHIVKKHLINEAVEEIHKAKRDGLEVVLLSASYSMVLHPFAQEYGINHVLSNEIKFNSHNRKCKAIIIGRDCYGKEKVKRLADYFNEFENSYKVLRSYSDSISDIPMLEIAEEPIVLSREKSQNWAVNMNYKEIIWH